MYEWDKAEFHCRPLPNGSTSLPFTQEHLNERMHQRRIRPGMYGMKTAYELWEAFKGVQVEKIRQGRDLKCSPGFGSEIRRIALTRDFDL